MRADSSGCMGGELGMVDEKWAYLRARSRVDGRGTGEGE